MLAPPLCWRHLVASLDLTNDYFSKLRSHNGQLICNETVTYKVERGVAISLRRLAEVATSSPIHHRGALREGDVMKRQGHSGRVLVFRIHGTFGGPYSLMHVKAIY